MSNPHSSPGSRPLEQLKVAELREELRKRGLSLKGVKKDLFERLDEAVQREQSGLLLSAEEERPKDAYGMYEPEGEHGIDHSAGQLSENVQDGDALLYLNDTENPLKDSALIVNNASPYVGSSDASSVFIEPGKDAGELNSGFVASEQSKDDVLLINNMNSVSSGAMPESINAEAGDAGRSDNIVIESNAFFSGHDKQTAETAASVSEPDEQCRGNEANLPAKEANDVVLLEDTLQAGGSDAVIPELTSQTDGNDGLLAAPELKSMNDIVSMDDGMIGETFALLQKPEAAEIACQDNMAIPSEPVKLASIASVSDDLLPVADAASLPASSFVGIANDSTAQEVEVIEKTALSSVNAVSSMLEPVKDSGGKVESVEDTIFKVETAEDTNQVELLESGEALIPPSADREAPVMPLGAATLDVVQDLVLSEVQRDMAVPESLQDSVMHEVVQDVVVQEVAQDVEMVEALKSPSMKVELPKPVLETKLPAVSIDTLDYSVGVKSENLGSLPADNSNQLNEAVIGMVDELKPNVKLEPAETESRAEGGIAPVEIVNTERQDVKEELPKSMRSYDRSQPKEREFERSRHELGRASAYGDDRTRAEGRSGRVFREERRKDPKERELKPAEEEFPSHNSVKRKDYDRDSRQQEPAKRARRWNSGAELVVEMAKPSGTVKEIMSPELNKEGFAVAPPRPTPKLSGPSRPTPALAKTNSEANGDKRAVPPTARAPTSSLKVERFVRPFTLKAVKDLLSEYGECVDFWMDQIKTHCYVMYSKVDEAVAARNGLYHKQWPLSFGNLLVADFVDPGDVKIRSDGTFEKMNTPPATTPRGVSNQPPQGAQLSGPFHGHSNSLAFAPAPRERQVMQVPVKEHEPQVPTLDDLFRKTKAKPHIYYLPLTDEQAAEKLASARDKEQLQARSRVPRRV